MTMTLEECTAIAEEIIRRDGTKGKFVITEDTMIYASPNTCDDIHDTVEVVLHRIQAVKNFGDVKIGDLGGWVEEEDNLDQEGECWIYDEAKVYYGSRVQNNARLHDNAEVNSGAVVIGESVLCADAVVRGDSIIGGQAVVFGTVTDSEIERGIIREKDILEHGRLENKNVHRTDYAIKSTQNEVILGEYDTLEEAEAHIQEFENAEIVETSSGVDDYVPHSQVIDDEFKSGVRYGKEYVYFLKATHALDCSIERAKNSNVLSDYKWDDGRTEYAMTECGAKYRYVFEQGLLTGMRSAEIDILEDKGA